MNLTGVPYNFTNEAATHALVTTAIAAACYLPLATTANAFAP
jgi:hypothetical protein